MIAIYCDRCQSDYAVIRFRGLELYDEYYLCSRCFKDWEQKNEEIRQQFVLAYRLGSIHWVDVLTFDEGEG